MKVYILGASGYLGGLLCAHWASSGKYEVFSDRIDIRDFAALQSKFNEVRPDVVINFAGVKAYPTIDWCEDHKEETIAVNVEGAVNVMRAALEVGAYPIQISSGCIYSGDETQLFSESDNPNFHGSFYSRMRIVLQNLLKDLPVLCVRIRMPLSMTPHPRNFIDKIASYQKVISIPNSVTLLEDLWPALERLIEIRPTGILNLTNEGYVTHDAILEAYREVVDPNHRYTKISLEELQGPGGITKAQRSNCVLSMEKAKSLGVHMPRLDAARLRTIMETYKSNRTGTMKGIILAGGKGTRLYPLTKITSKQLLPIYDQPMVFYPLQTLLRSGITDILFIIAPEHAGDFLNLLGSGKQFGAKFSYEIQDKPEGLAQAFLIAADFIGDDNVTLILGDNIFEDDFSDAIRKFKKGGHIFAKKVPDPERFGVVEFDQGMSVTKIVEKPKEFISPYAITGLYIYDNRVVKAARSLKPSDRNELEITDLHNWYLQENDLKVDIIDGEWVDAGTFDSLMRASAWASAKKKGVKEEPTY